jgi:hypothetical protein
MECNYCAKGEIECLAADILRPDAKALTFFHFICSLSPFPFAATNARDGTY